MTGRHTGTQAFCPTGRAGARYSSSANATSSAMVTKRAEAFRGSGAPFGGMQAPRSKADAAVSQRRH